MDERCHGPLSLKAAICTRQRSGPGHVTRPSADGQRRRWAMMGRSQHRLLCCRRERPSHPRITPADAPCPTVPAGKQWGFREAAPFRHAFRRELHWDSPSSRPSKARRRRGGMGRFHAAISTPSLAQDAGTGSKHLFPLPDGPHDGPAPRHARKGAPPHHAGLAAHWAREGKGPSHVLGRSP